MKRYLPSVFAAMVVSTLVGAQYIDNATMPPFFGTVRNGILNGLIGYTIPDPVNIHTINTDFVDAGQVLTPFLQAAGVDAGTVIVSGTLTASAVNASTFGTAGSGTGITASPSGALRHFVNKVTVINTALTAAGQTDLTLLTTPVNSRIVRVVADVTQVFTGGALSAVTITVGNTAGGNQYLLSNSVLTATNTWGDVVAEMGAGVVSATLADFGTVATGVPGALTVQTRFTCTGANCNAATQGSVTFYIEYVVYP